MGLKALVIAPAAKCDLKDIYAFGLQQWGIVKSEIYLKAIQNQLLRLMQYAEIGVDRAKLLSGLRSVPIKSHVVFYRIRAGRIEIIRILHGRQDPFFHFGAGD